MEEKKFCKFCGEKIDKDSIVCTKCGRQLKELKIEEKKEIIEEKNKIQKKFYEQQWFMWVMLILFAPIGILFMWKFNDKIKKNTKIILTIVFGIIFLIMLFSGNDETTNNNSNTNNNKNNDYVEENKDNNINQNNIPTTTKKNEYTLGDTIIFDDLELTFDKNYTFTSIENRFSDYNGKPVIKIGVNIKNLSPEKHNLNMFYYDFFGSQGIELDDISAYFEESVDDGGELKSGASYKKYFYILYDGNGTYSIDFDNYSQEISVEFIITK